MATLKTNTLSNDNLRALNGPVPQLDGRLAAVVEANDKWHYTLGHINPRVKEGRALSPPFATPVAAREALAENLPGEEAKAWREEPFNTMEPGKPWFRQRVGEREIPAEAVFVRACFTGNENLALAASKEITRPNATDAQGNTLLIYAAGMKDSQEPMRELLAAGADPKRFNAQGWSPAHAAAAQGDSNRLVPLQEKGANLNLCDATGAPVLSFLPAADRKQFAHVLTGPSRKTQAPAVRTPQMAEQDKNRKRSPSIERF